MTTPRKIASLLIAALALAATATGAETTPAAQGGSAPAPTADAPAASPAEAATGAETTPAAQGGPAPAPTPAVSPAEAACNAALAARDALLRADREAALHFRTDTLARWRATKSAAKDAIYAHIPTLAAGTDPRRETIIYEYAHRLQRGLAPAPGAPDQKEVWLAAKAVNPIRYFSFLAPRSEVEAALAGPPSDENVRIADAAFRRFYAGGRRAHNAASGKVYQAYLEQARGHGITHSSYVGWFRRRVNAATLAEAIQLLDAEVEGLLKRYAPLADSLPPFVMDLVNEYRASLVALRELQSFESAPAAPQTTTSVDTAPPPRDALAKARAAAGAGAHLAPPDPGRYSPLWFRRQRLDNRRAAGEDSPELAEAYADYYAALLAAH